MASDYDADNNEAIDRDEALATVVDYFSGSITQEEALEVVRALLRRLIRRAGERERRREGANWMNDGVTKR